MNANRLFAAFRRLSVPVVCAVLLSLVATASGSATSMPTRLAHSISGPGVWRPVAQNTNPDGTVRDEWRDMNGTEVVATGVPGLAVTVSSENVSAGNGGTVNHLIVVGFTRAISKANFATKPAPAGAAQLASSIYTTSCVSVKSNDGHVHGYGCDTENLDQTIGWDWYLADQHQASAYSDCASNYFCDHLRQVNEWETWVSGNQVIQWTPGSSSPVGSCTNFTVSYTSSRTGTGYTESTDICPNTLGPYVLNATQFGSIWKGLAPDQNNYYEAAESEDEVHNPPNVATSMTYRIGMGWCSGCF